MEGSLGALRLLLDMNQPEDDEMSFCSFLCANRDALSSRCGTQPSNPPVTPDSTNTERAFCTQCSKMPLLVEISNQQVKVSC